MGSYHTTSQICAAMLLSIVPSFFPKARGDATEHLEWQLPIDSHGYSSVTVRASTEKLFTGEFTGEVTISGKTGQAFIVCAKNLSSEDFYHGASTAFPATSLDSSTDSNVHALTLANAMGKLTVEQSTPCPKYLRNQYPIASEQHIRSEKPFFVVSKRTDKSEDNQNSDVIIPVSFPITPKSLLSFSGGSGGSQDIDDQNNFKRPPFMPAPDKVMANLILLPTLNLPVNWRDYHPFAGLYHWLTDTAPLGVAEGVTILVRFDDMPTVTFRISRAESLELAENLLNARQLLHWLAPRLSGREQLIQQLLDLSAGSNEEPDEQSSEQPSYLPEETLKSIRKQLAIVLEQPDTEFSLQFESLELARILNRQDKTQSPPGIIQLGTTQSTTTRNTGTGGDTRKQSSSSIPAGNQSSKKTQENPEQDHHIKQKEFLKTELANTVDHYTIRLHQTEYHIDKWQVLENLDKPASATNLSLSCMDCQQDGISLQDMLSHAESHRLTCDQCQQFEPTTGTFEARQKMLEGHTQSQCKEYKGEVLAAPLMDDSISVFRFMIRFGTEETLLDLLQQFDLPVTAEDLSQTDRHQRTMLHDLTQYSSPKVVQTFLELFKQSITADLVHTLFACGHDQLIYDFIDRYYHQITRAELSAEALNGETLLHILFEKASPTAIARLIDNNTIDLNSELLGKNRARDGNTPAHLLFARGDNALTTTFLNRHSHYIDNTVATATNHVGVSVLQVLSQHYQPAAEPSEALLAELLASLGFESEPTALPAKTTIHTEGKPERTVTSPEKTKEINPAEQGEHGRTALHEAAEKGDIARVKLLIEQYELDREARLHEGAKIKSFDFSGANALHLAAYGGQPDMIRLLINEFGLDRNVKYYRGRTVLHSAALGGHPEVIRLLVDEFGLDRNVKDDDDRTTLHFAALGGHPEVIRLLIDEFKLDRNAKAHTGKTVLHFAANADSLEVIRLLINEFELDRNIKDSFGRTVLHFAAAGGSPEVIRLLIDELKVDRNIKSNQGATALHYALCGGYPEIIELLINTFGLDKNAKDDDGFTLLHYAALNGHSGVIGLLVDKFELDRNIKDNNGNTALFSAAFGGHPEVIRLLVDEFGLDRNVKSNRGKTSSAFRCFGGPSRGDPATD